MVKTLISMLCVGIILLAGGIYETTHIRNEFEDFNRVLNILYDKVEEESATANDVYAVQKNWHGKKRNLHAFISHTEIREVEMWISETVTLVQDKAWTDALSKVEVLIELSEQIPKNFMLKLENVL